MRITVTGINVIKRRLASGATRTYFYHRKTGERLSDDPVEAATQARKLDGIRPKREGGSPGSLAALITAYKSSADYLQLAPKTRKDYARYLEILREMWGGYAVAAFGRRHVKKLKEIFQHKPRTANYVVQVFRILMTIAVDEEMREYNPASRPKLLRTGDGHRPWEEDEIAAYRARWAAETRERVAFELTINSGQRGEDAVVLRRPHYRGGWLNVKQLKGGSRVDVPASNDLIAVLDPFLATHGAMTLLADARGLPFTVDAFRHFMREAYDAAGLPKTCTTHGLRYTAASILQELGCDDQTIADITGHETLAMVRKYTAKRRRARLAIDMLNRASADKP